MRIAYTLGQKLDWVSCLGIAETLSSIFRWHPARETQITEQVRHLVNECERMCFTDRGVI